jgi:vacuolar-type H+-ATPase subunit C/Vma6
VFHVLAPFFVDCISEQDLDEMNIEIIRNTLYKAYLEAFFNFCKELGGTTADVMCEILAVSSEWKHCLCVRRKECQNEFTVSILTLKIPS